MCSRGCCQWHAGTTSVVCAVIQCNASTLRSIAQGGRPWNAGQLPVPARLWLRLPERPPTKSLPSCCTYHVHNPLLEQVRWQVRRCLVCSIARERGNDLQHLGW
jgi:hypothetical protein